MDKIRIVRTENLLHCQQLNTREPPKRVNARGRNMRGSRPAMHTQSNIPCLVFYPLRSAALLRPAFSTFPMNVSYGAPSGMGVWRAEI